MNEHNEIKEDRMKKKITYIVTIACFLGMMLLCLFNEGILQQETAQDAVKVISNAFFLPGVLFAGIGGISKIASTGEFDMLGYGFSSIGIHQLIPGMPKDKYSSYMDYKKSKEENGRRWFPNMLFVGLAGIFISAVFVVIYSVM